MFFCKGSNKNIEGNRILLLADCIWFDVYLHDSDNPPAYDGDISWFASIDLRSI